MNDYPPRPPDRDNPRLPGSDPLNPAENPTNQDIELGKSPSLRQKISAYAWMALKLTIGSLRGSGYKGTAAALVVAGCINSALLCLQSTSIYDFREIHAQFPEGFFVAFSGFVVYVFFKEFGNRNIQLDRDRI